MRFSSFSGKEIINLDNGERVGTVAQTDLIIHPETGEIESMVMPDTRWFGLRKGGDDIVIPWSSIRKVGPEMIIVEIKQRKMSLD